MKLQKLKLDLSPEPQTFKTIQAKRKAETMPGSLAASCADDPFCYLAKQANPSAMLTYVEPTTAW
jgi:hypothetical protein